MCIKYCIKYYGYYFAEKGPSAVNGSNTQVAYYENPGILMVVQTIEDSRGTKKASMGYTVQSYLT